MPGFPELEGTTSNEASISERDRELLEDFFSVLKTVRAEQAARDRTPSRPIATPPKLFTDQELTILKKAYLEGKFEFQIKFPPDYRESEVVVKDEPDTLLARMKSEAEAFREATRRDQEETRQLMKEAVESIADAEQTLQWTSRLGIAHPR